MNWRRSAILRKSVALAQQLPRAAVRLTSRDEDYRARPPVLANSCPKSGTHLLLQVLEALPVRRYGTFLASQPSVPFRERTVATMSRKIARLIPGELAPGHLYHAPPLESALARRGVIHYLIYRDPRDVAVSEAHYLTHMNRWHRLHRTFAALPDDEARIRYAITGNGDSVRAPYDYPDLAARFARFVPWIGRDDVCAVRFEDLAGPRQAEEVRRIVAFYAARGGAVDVESLTATALANIDPKRSHTFRQGRVGGWRDAMTAEHRVLVKRVAGPLLIELGYERDDAW